jgi:hypothetical protein
LFSVGQEVILAILAIRYPQCGTIACAVTLKAK